MAGTTDNNFRVKNGLSVNGNLIVASSGAVGINTASPQTTFHVSSNDGLIIPSGGNAQRPNIISNTGVIRYNTDLSAYEVSFNGSWSVIVAANSNNQVFSQILSPTDLFEITGNNVLSYSSNVITLKAGGVVNWTANSSTFNAFSLYANSSAVRVGSGAANLTLTSSSLVIANSTVSLSITPPTAAQIANNSWFLNANGSWGLVLFQPVGSDTQLQYNDGGAWGSSAGLTFNKTTTTLTIANTLSTGNLTAVTASFANTLTVTGNSTFNSNVTMNAILNLLAPTAGIEIGSLTSNGTPYIDFHSSGSGNDYDVRIITSGGTSGINGNGSITIAANSLTTNAAINLNGVLSGNVISANVFSGNTITLNNAVNVPLGNVATVISTSITSNTVGANSITANTGTIVTFSTNTVVANVVYSGSVVANTVWTNGNDANGANIRVISGNYGVIFRNDGTNMWFLQTANGAATATYNTFRPFSWNLATGAVTVDSTGLGTYFGGAVTHNGNINFNANSYAITWPNGVQIYQDTSGNGPGDIIFKTVNGANTAYSYFANNGSLAVSNNIFIGGSGTLGGAAYINDTSAISRLITPAGGTSTYRSGSGNAGYQHQFEDAGGTVRWILGNTNASFNFYCAGDVIAGWSDVDLKEMIVSVNPNEGLERVKKYNVVRYSWNETGRKFNGKKKGERQIGLIAQEAQKVNPDVVTTNDSQFKENGEPYLSVMESKIVFDLISAVQAQQKQIDELRRRIKVLEN